MNTTELGRAMREESEALERFSALQGELEAAVRARDWKALERTVAELGVLAAAVESMDADRERVFRALLGREQAPGEGAMEELLSRLTGGAREELAALHRRLKVAVIRVRSRTAVLDHYLRTLSGALGGVLEELFPHRKGRLYNRSGRTRGVRDHSLVVDRRL